MLWYDMRCGMGLVEALICHYFASIFWRCFYSVFTHVLGRLNGKAGPVVLATNELRILLGYF